MQKTVPSIGVRGPPERDMLFLGAGGEGTLTGPWWSCVAAVAVAVAARPGGRGEEEGEGESKEAFLHERDLQCTKKNVRHAILHRISIPVTWQQ